MARAWPSGCTPRGAGTPYRGYGGLCRIVAFALRPEKGSCKETGVGTRRRGHRGCRQTTAEKTLLEAGNTYACGRCEKKALLMVLEACICTAERKQWGARLHGCANSCGFPRPPPKRVDSFRQYKAQGQNRTSRWRSKRKGGILRGQGGSTWPYPAYASALHRSALLLWWWRSSIENPRLYR